MRVEIEWPKPEAADRMSSLEMTKQVIREYEKKAKTLDRRFYALLKAYDKLSKEEQTPTIIASFKQAALTHIEEVAKLTAEATERVKAIDELKTQQV